MEDEALLLWREARSNTLAMPFREYRNLSAGISDADAVMLATIYNINNR
jgi:hypothetical protein